MIFNTVIYNKKINTVPLTITQNGEYLPSQSSADAFSSVEVAVPRLTLSKATLKQYGNYLSVDHTNGVSADTFDFYVDGALKCSKDSGIISLTELLGEANSGSVSVELKNSNEKCEPSGLSDGIEVTINNYTECTVKLSNGIVSVTDIESTPSSVHIPPFALFNGVLYPITVIEKGAFNGKSGINTVRGDNIKTIYAKAFNGVDTLTSVSFPSLNELIGVDIFKGTSLTELNLKNVRIINAKGLLVNNKVPCTVTMPTDSKVDTVYSDTFANANLGQILLETNFAYIDDYAFENAKCKYLEMRFWNVETASNAFKNADFMGENGMIIFNIDSIHKRYNYSDAVNLAFSLVMAKGDTFTGSIDVNGNDVKFEIFQNLDNAFNRVDALTVSGGSYTATRSGKYYLRIVS